MNRAPDACPECQAQMHSEPPKYAYNKHWDEERDGPQYPNGWFQWLTITSTTDVDDRGVTLLECPRCFYQFEFQAFDAIPKENHE